MDDISEATKISVRLLRAIENEEFDRLPGGVFNINFVRQFARHLGLEEEKVVSEFRRITAPPADPATPQRPVLPGEWEISSDYEWDRQRHSQIWRFALLVVLVAGTVGGLYLWWTERRAAPPEPVASGTSSPAAAPSQLPPATHPQSAPPPLANSTAPETSTTAGAAPGRSEAAAPPPASPPREAPAAGEPAPVAGEAPLRVDIQATDTVWVAASTDGQVRFQTTLLPEQTRTVTAQSMVRLRLGNAGAVKLTFNGVAQPVPGPKGHIRTVIFTSQGMEVVAPSPPEQAPVEREPEAPPPPRPPSQQARTPAAQNR